MRLHRFGKHARRFIVCALAVAVGVCGWLPAVRVRGDDASAASQASQTEEPQVTAETAVAMDADTGQIYYQKNMHQQMYPASITKIMTGLLTVEQGNPSDAVTVQKDIGKSQSRDYTNIALQPGEQLTEEELLYTMFLASANDSAQALAEQVGGSVDHFVTMMNDRARELGGTETSFSNPNGLPDVNNKTSAHDMALIAAQAVKTDELKYFGAEHYTLPATNLRAKPEAFTTLVKMLRHDSKYYYSGIIAAKSGWTVMSGYTLVTVVKRDDRTIVCVVMKSSDGEAVMTDSQKLLDYAFTQKQIVPAKTDPVVQNTENAVQAAVGRAEHRGSPSPDSRTVWEMALTAVSVAAVLVMLAVIRRRARARRT